jgi:hypothetical protein
MAAVERMCASPIGPFATSPQFGTFPRRPDIPYSARAAHQRAAEHVRNPHLARCAGIRVEGLRRHVGRHRQVRGGGPEVLPHGQGSEAHISQRSQQVEHLVVRLAQADHEPALGDDIGRLRARPPQQLQRAREIGLGPHFGVQPRDRLHVMV